jgi:proteasome beta subunit
MQGVEWSSRFRDLRLHQAGGAIIFTMRWAQFEVADYAATGSGSPAVRGILYYENNWGGKPLQKLGEDQAVSIALRALDTAAESDTATGGVDRSGKIYPLIKIVSREGITTLPDRKIAAVFKETVA